MQPHFADDENPDRITLKDLASLMAVAVFCLAVMIWLPLIAPVAP